MSESRNSSFVSQFIDLVQRSTIKNWSRILSTQILTSPSKNCFINLTDVHTRRYPKWIQHDINRCSVLKERHIFVTNDTSNNTFVTVTSRHLIPYFQLTFFGDVNFSQFQDSRWQFISNSNRKFLSS